MEKLYTEREAAKFIGVTPGHMRRWRGAFAVKREGPAWLRIGNAPNSGIRYPESELEKWKRSRLEASGSISEAA